MNYFKCILICGLVVVCESFIQQKAQNAYDFALKVSQAAIAATPDNIFLSISGLVESIAILYEASGGDTRKLIREVARCSPLKFHHRETFKNNRALLQDAVGTKAKFIQTSTMLYDERLNVSWAFGEIMNNVYEADLVPLPKFKPHEVVEKINEWISVATNHQLNYRSPYKKPYDLRESVLIIVTANSFAGEWEVPFEPSKTKPMLFHNANGKPSNVPFMTREGRFLARNVNKLKAHVLRLNYRDSRFALLLMTPQLSYTLDDVLMAITLPILRDSLPTEYNVMTVSLPKFKIKSEVIMNQYLQEAGLEPLFKGRVNISDMTNIPFVRLTDVTQVTNLQVNETSTTADSIIEMSIGFRSLDEPSRFVFNKPFIVMLFETKNFFPVYIGKVAQL